MKIIHWWNNLILLRNWHVKHHLNKKLRGNNFNVLDSGCGEGQHLFWMKDKFPNHKYNAIDKTQDNADFCNHVLKENTCTVADIHTFKSPDRFDLILLIGVLQYVENDELAFKNLINHLTPNGEILIYCPTKRKDVLPYYEKVLNSFSHYEKVQNRQREYNLDRLLKLINSCGGKITETKNTVGTLGKITQEYYSLFLAIFGKANSNVLGVLFLVFFLYPVIPLLLLFNFLDFHFLNQKGNGVLLSVQNN